MRPRSWWLLFLIGAIPHPGIAQQGVVAGDQPAHPLVEQIRDGGDPTLFWRQVASKGTPLVTLDSAHPGFSLVTFVHRESDSAATVEFQSNIASIDPDAEASSRVRMPMRWVPGSDVWLLTLRLRNDIRAPYHIVVRPAGDSVAVEMVDSLNPAVWEAEQSALRASILELPGAPPQPWRTAGAEMGKWRQVALTDAAGEKRTAFIYLPPGWHDDSTASYPALIGLGAFPIGIGMRADWIVDRLIAEGNLPPIVLGLIDVTNRSSALRYQDMDQFVAEVLLPELRQRFHVSDHAEQIAITGTSRRGMVASLLALRRPDLVGNVISLSGSYYWRPDDASEFAWVPARYATTPRQPLRFFVTAGRLETFVNPGNRGHYLVGTNRHFRDVLRAAGYDVRYEEYNGVHSELNWQDGLAAGLRHFFGSEAR